MTEQKRKDTQGPTDAETVMFEALDRFYFVLEKQGHREALKAAHEVLERLPPISEVALRMRGARDAYSE